jgi:hypothetical protein
MTGLAAVAPRLDLIAPFFASSSMALSSVRSALSTLGTM